MAENVDVLVVGGGIAGVGVAQFAAAAGFRVLLVERAAIGGATSGNSSKLIHGGLRYLESYQFDLVRESLKARRDLLRLAPTLVKAVPFYIPLYRGSKRGALTLRAGLSLYGLLSDFDPLGRFRQVPASEWHMFDGLLTEGLESVFQYWDAQTDDNLLCQAVAHSAATLGVDILEHSGVEAIVHSAAGCDVTVLSQSSDGEPLQRQVRASLVVNACGPWVNELLDKVSPPAHKLPIDWVQGAHLLLELEPPEGILYLESPIDRRVVFVMPWYGNTMIGTTETRLSSLAARGITEAEKRYLLSLYQHYFPHKGDMATLDALICGSFCGVRVLPKTPGDAFDAPRETLFHLDAVHPRLMSIYGGKLTTFRSSAAKVLEWIVSELGERPRLADVERLILHRAPPRDDFSGQTG